MSSDAVGTCSHVQNLISAGAAGRMLGKWSSAWEGGTHHFSQLGEFILFDVSLLLGVPATKRFSQELKDLVLKCRAAVSGQLQEHVTGCLPPCFPRQAAQVLWNQIVAILLH